MSAMSLEQALNIMDARDSSGNPMQFSMEFVKRSTGELISVANAVKLMKKSSDTVVKGRSGADSKMVTPRKNPHHSENMTRNIQVLPSKEIRKVHIRLITRFNNYSVYW